MMATAANNNVAAQAGGGGGMPGGNRADIANARRFNTYIYDYFLKNKMYDCARACLTSNIPLLIDENAPRPSPGRRPDGMNGVDENMDMDHLKDEAGDLPMPKLNQSDKSDNSMLFDWWCIFWDMWGARQNPNKFANTEIQQYLRSLNVSCFSFFLLRHRFDLY
jgi:hypothetical protein